MMTSNHKKLVNACYNPVTVKNNKNLGTISPDANSVSKLSYYCATRPHKINKITTYLISYAHSQARPASFTSALSIYRHSKPGLICTIKIFHALLDNPAIHLRLLGPHIATIIAIGLGLFNQAFSSEPILPLPTSLPDSSNSNSPAGFFGNDWVAKDLDIARAAIHLFSAYAHSIRADCLQDNQLARNYLFFLAKFSAVASVCPSTTSIIKSKAIPAPSTRPAPARCMALMALESATKASALYSSPYFKRQMQMILPGLMACIIPSGERPADELLTLIHQASEDGAVPPSSGASEDFHSQLLHEMSMLRSLISPPSPPKLPSCTELHLISFSITTLHFLLRVQLSNLHQFEISIHQFLAQVEASISPSSSSSSSGHHHQYYAWLGASLLRWAMPKYRSSVIDMVVDRLTWIDSKQQQQQQNHCIETQEKQKQQQQQQQKYAWEKMGTLAGMLKAMMTDPVAGRMELLNTLNIQHQLIRLVESIHGMPGAATQQAQRVSDVLMQVVEALAYTVYYDEQIHDMCKEVCARIRLLVNPPAAASADSSQHDLPSSSSPAAAYACDPALVVALLDALHRILVNSSTGAHAHHDPSSSPSAGLVGRPPVQPLPVSPSVWKDHLLVIDSLRDAGCRRAFFRALGTYIKRDAFRACSERPAGDLLLVQFLHAISVSVFRDIVGTLSPAADAHQATNEDASNPRLFSAPSMTSREANGDGPSSVDPAGWYPCMLEIFRQQHYAPLAVCLPMLREVHRYLMPIINSPAPVLAQCSPPSDLPHSAKTDLVVDCLLTIGKVWKLEHLPDAITSVKANGSTPIHTRLVDWQSVLGMVCGSPLVQQKAGLDQAALEAHFLGHEWTLVEARTQAGWTASASHYSRASIAGSLVGGTRGRRRTGSIVGRTGEGRQHGYLTKTTTTTTTPRVQQGGGGGGSAQGSVSTMLGAPSVSDLRNSLLGTGFFPAGPGTNASISGRSSVLLATTSPHDLLTHSADLLGNLSTGDLARYVVASAPATAAAAHARRSYGGPLEEFGRLGPATTVQGRSVSVYAPGGHHPRNDPSSTSGTVSSSSHRPHAQQDHPRPHRVSLARRQTLTSEILDKVRKTSIARSDRGHHPQTNGHASPNNDHNHDPDPDLAERDYALFIRNKNASVAAAAGAAVGAAVGADADAVGDAAEGSPPDTAAFLPTAALSAPDGPVSPFAIPHSRPDQPLGFLLPTPVSPRTVVAFPADAAVADFVTATTTTTIAATTTTTTTTTTATTTSTAVTTAAVATAADTTAADTTAAETETGHATSATAMGVAGNTNTHAARAADAVLRGPSLHKLAPPRKSIVVQPPYALD